MLNFSLQCPLPVTDFPDLDDLVLGGCTIDFLFAPERSSMSRYLSHGVEGTGPLHLGASANVMGMMSPLPKIVRKKPLSQGSVKTGRGLHVLIASAIKWL